MADRTIATSLSTIPFYSIRPQLDASVSQAVQAALASGWYVLGEKLKAFEVAFASYTGVSHCLGTGNGHDALVLALRAAGLGNGDEVIVPSNTYIATWIAVSNAGCVPVPVEPCEDTVNIDPQRISAAITSRTRAIVPVHLYGNPCAMGAILDLAKKHSLIVVEDNAQAHGARWNGHRTGSFGLVNATSFYPTKNLGALGDGGAVTTNDAGIAERIAVLRNYGKASKDLFSHIGINSRLDELQAAVLSARLQRLDELNAQRRWIARYYLDHLAGVGDLILPYETAAGEHVYHQFVIRSSFRDRLRDDLAKVGIETMVHYAVPPHLQGAYAGRGWKRGAFPIAEQMADEVLSLPIWPGMREEQVERVVKGLRTIS